MSEVVTVLWLKRDPYAEDPWDRVDLPYQNGTTVKHYLHQRTGLVGLRSNRSLRRLVGQHYERIRLHYVPGPGDVIALVPKGW